VHNRYDMMDVNEYRDLATKLYSRRIGGTDLIVSDFDPAINTDWQKVFAPGGQ
jgi:hypothetical protein